MASREVLLQVMPDGFGNKLIVLLVGEFVCYSRNYGINPTWACYVK